MTNVKSLEQSKFGQPDNNTVQTENYIWQFKSLNKKSQYLQPIIPEKNVSSTKNTILNRCNTCISQNDKVWTNNQI